MAPGWLDDYDNVSRSQVHAQFFDVERLRRPRYALVAQNWTKALLADTGIGEQARAAIASGADIVNLLRWPPLPTPGIEPFRLRLHAPTISGSPVLAAQAAQPYAFQPGAADADGDALTFSIANKPAWGTFERATGLLYGTPSSTDIGTIYNVVVTVSDGKASASLPAFSITVAAQQTGSAELRWTPPTHNVDGSPITDLAGYLVSYGTAPRSYTVSLPINGASINNVTIEGLEAGTYYFAVKAVNAAGTVSDYSNEASKSL